MDLKLKNKNFIVTGVTSGFGRSVTEKLIIEGANVLGVARREELLREMKNNYGEQFNFLVADITEDNSVNELVLKSKNQKISGVFINAGGPPAKSFEETKLQDWDNAYYKLLRWKVNLTKQLIPGFIEQNYGRIIFLESSSVKQPIENLVLSTSLRMSVVGMAKTLSQELADKGITVNVIAPGSHNTSAIERLIQKKSEMIGVSYNEAKQFSKKILKLVLWAIQMI